jgi:hypothetical protein
VAACSSTKEIQLFRRYHFFHVFKNHLRSTQKKYIEIMINQFFVVILSPLDLVIIFPNYRGKMGIFSCHY